MYSRARTSGGFGNLSSSISLSLSLTTHNYNKLTTAEIRCNSMSFSRCHRRVSFADYQIHTGIRSLSDRYWFVLRANFSSRFAACTRYFPTVHQISHGNSLELVCASSCQRITTRNSNLVNRFVRSFFFFFFFLIRETMGYFVNERSFLFFSPFPFLHSISLILGR